MNSNDFGATLFLFCVNSIAFYENLIEFNANLIVANVNKMAS